jgi:hypothetical protein
LSAVYKDRLAKAIASGDARNVSFTLKQIGSALSAEAQK